MGWPRWAAPSSAPSRAAAAGLSFQAGQSTTLCGYHVEGSAPIELDGDRITAGNHVVFAARILVETVLLAAFLQAIAVVQRGRKLMDMFYTDAARDQLDPFREPHELRKLFQPAVAGNQLARASIEHTARNDGAKRLRGEADRLARTWGWRPDGTD